MNTITIRDVPPGIHRTLKTRAHAHGRSLNKEILVTLESLLHGALIDGKAVGKHAQSVREAMGVYLTQEELTARKDAGRP
jgi:plasmid stability protein